MKTLKFINAAVVAACLAGPMAFAASEGGDKGNGGNTVNNQLLDLVTNARCDRWSTGADFMRENRHIEKTLSVLGKIHWPLATLLRQRIEALDFCMTGALKKVSLEKYCDGASPVTMYTKGREQAAVRIDSDVYVDRFIFNAMASDKERAYLMIHEAAHDFFPQCSDMRTFRLHTFVKNIEKLESGVIKSREDFIFQMEKNGIDMNFGSGNLDSLRSATEFLRLDYASKRKKVLALESGLFMMNKGDLVSIKAEICGQDSYAEVCAYTVDRLYAEPAAFLKSALIAKDITVVEALLNVSLVQNQDAMIGQRAIADGFVTSSDAVNQAVLKSETMKSVMRIFNRMDIKDPVVKNSRLYLPAVMDNLFPATSTLPIYRAARIAESSELAQPAHAIVTLWSAFGSTGSSLLKDVSYGNPNVVTGLSLLGFAEKVKAKAVLQDDAELAIKGSVWIMQAFFSKAKAQMLKAGMKQEKINELFNQFDESYLGYKAQE